MKAVKIIAFLGFVFIIFASASNVFAADENNIDSVHAENNTISAGDSSVNGNFEDLKKDISGLKTGENFKFK